MTPKISVLVPTRGRTALLHTMLQSLVTFADEPASVEVVFRLDLDDHETLTYLQHQAIEAWLTLLSPSPCVVGPHYNGYATLPAMINEAARLSTAPLLIVINDDVEFKTQGWDTKLIAAAEAFPDGFFDLGVDTVNNNKNFVFPCQSRKQVELLGGFYDERLVYPDIWLRDVLVPFGRAVRADHIRIEHQWVGRSHEQEDALRRIVCTAAYDRLYAQCVKEGQEKIAAALEAVAS